MSQEATSTFSKKFTPGKSIPRSKESIAAEIEKHDAEMKRYQANAAFLAKVAEGDLVCWNAQIEQAKAAKATKAAKAAKESIKRAWMSEPLETPVCWTRSLDAW
jgi:hypothetical protein